MMISSFLTASQLVASDAFVSNRASSSPESHLQAAVQWLKKAHDSSADDGVSYGYCMRGPSLRRIAEVGWKPSYVETSGYIATTFYDLFHTWGDDDCRCRAESVARWLLTVQNPDGSFSNDRFARGRGIVFDTGQVLLGLVRAYAETGDFVFRDAAKRAAEWLAESLDADGAWRRNTHLSCVHTYNSRVAWAMLELCELEANENVRCAAAANLEWSAAQSRNGLYENCAFQTGLPPFTHTIAYAIRGIYEGGMLLKNDHLVDVARHSADRMMSFVREDGHIPGRIDVEGNPRSKSCCLTGNCQMAIIWLKMARQFDIPEMKQAAEQALQYVMSVQDIKTNDSNVFGAIKGSHPVWGKYAPLSYPNWATKFFIDAMLLLND